jgi:hypothetical protein
MKWKFPPFASVIPLASLLGAVVAGVMLGVEVALLVIAGGALVSVIALLWSSVQSLTGESPITLDEALSLGAPSAEEEQKRAVLRALKDLEFERGVGKISEDDYAELSAKFRAEARRLILAVDEVHEKERAEIERKLAQRLAHEPREKPVGGDAAIEDGDESAPPSSRMSTPEPGATSESVGKEST